MRHLRILPSSSGVIIGRPIAAYENSTLPSKLLLHRPSLAGTMGGCDAYCALCGGVTSEPFLEELSGGSNDAPIIAIDNTEWMQDVRIMGENPTSHSPEK